VEKNNTAVLWIRVSSDNQSKGYSPDAQERLLEEFAAKSKFRVVEKFKISESAKTSDNRKQFKAMITFIRENEVGNLVALAEDRLTRNYDDLTTLQRLIDKEGLTVVLADSGRSVNRESPGEHRFLFALMGLLAETENRVRSKKVRQGMNEKAKQGILPRWAPLGYQNIRDPQDPEGKRRIIVKDKVRAPLVKRLLELYAGGGYSIVTLQEEAVHIGLKSRRTNKYPERALSDHVVEDLLRNRFYYGEVAWDGETYPSKCEALISRETWNRIQKQKELNRTYSRPAAKKYFAFKPFLRCGYCGASITAEAQDGRHKKGKFVYYRCTGSKGKCGQKYIRQEDIDAHITSALGELAIPAWMATEISSRLKESHERETATEKAEFNRLRSEEGRKRSHIEILYDDRLNRVISSEEYQQRADVIKSDLARIAEDIAKLGNRNFKYKEEGILILDILSGLKETYSKADYPGKVKILAVVLNRVILQGEDTRFVWRPPFDYLFDISRTLKENQGFEEKNIGAEGGI
jgi:site-specific DNA recombinase